MTNFLIGLLIELHSKAVAPEYVPLHILMRAPVGEFNVPSENAIESYYNDFNNIEHECETTEGIDYALRTHLYSEWRTAHES